MVLSDFEELKKEIEEALDTKGSWAVVRRKKRFVDNPVPERCFCWSDAYGQAEASCTTCYGTGFTGGYYPAEVLKADFIKDKQSWTKTDYGMMVTSKTRALVKSEPLLTDNDLFFLVIVSVDGEPLSIIEKYKVQSEKDVLFENTIVAQELDLVGATSADVVDKVGL